MDWLDGIIILVLAAAIIRGIDLGMVRQLFSTAGFFGGLFLGAWLEGHVIHIAQATSSRALLSLVTILGCGFLFLALAEVIANIVKSRIALSNFDKADRFLGATVAGMALLGVVWLGASVYSNTPFPTLQQQIRDSAIISRLNSVMPPAPQVISKLGHLMTPNGFPQVFTEAEPEPTHSVAVPDMGDLTPAVNATKASVVKIEGEGCGGIVSGSGFVADEKLVVTNAHVVAGVATPTVIDKNGTHKTKVVWFNPDLDLAVLRTDRLAGEPLSLATTVVADGTQAAVVGYPGGGTFRADPAAIIDSFTASGRNIYNQDTAVREIYSMKADIISGNSGGPLIDRDGTVIGVVFANSVAYQQVGYALTMPQVVHELSQAKQQDRAISTGSCAQ